MKVGDFVIHEDDAPDDRMVAQITRIQNGLIYAKYIEAEAQKRFGKGEIYGPDFSLVSDLKAGTATYADGKPRKWQGA